MMIHLPSLNSHLYKLQFLLKPSFFSLGHFPLLINLEPSLPILQLSYYIKFYSAKDTRVVEYQLLQIILPHNFQYNFHLNIYEFT
jgi:hypothetical protein